VADSKISGSNHNTCCFGNYCLSELGLALIMAFVVGWMALTLAGSTGSSRLNYSGNASQRAQGKKEGDDFVVNKRICEVSKRYCQGEKARQIAKDLGVSITSVRRGIKKAKKENIIREGS